MLVVSYTVTQINSSSNNYKSSANKYIDVKLFPVQYDHLISRIIVRQFSYAYTAVRQYSLKDNFKYFP